jgi:hypothetical protein
MLPEEAMSFFSNDGDRCLLHDMEELSELDEARLSNILLDEELHHVFQWILQQVRHNHFGCLRRYEIVAFIPGHNFDLELVERDAPALAQFSEVPLI